MNFTKGEQNNDYHKRRTGIAGYAAQGNAGEKKPYADYADCWGTSGRQHTDPTPYIRQVATKGIELIREVCPIK